MNNIKCQRVVTKEDLQELALLTPVKMNPLSMLDINMANQCPKTLSLNFDLRVEMERITMEAEVELYSS